MYNKNEMDGLETWPKFEQGMHFYVPISAAFVELKGCSNNLLLLQALRARTCWLTRKSNGMRLTPRPFNEHRGKTKFCVHCGNVATQEGLFEVDGASLIEKYCDICVKKIK